MALQTFQMMIFVCELNCKQQHQLIDECLMQLKPQHQLFLYMDEEKRQSTPCFTIAIQNTCNECDKEPKRKIKWNEFHNFGNVKT